MEVYQNGFAVYRKPHHFAVLRMESVGTVKYTGYGTGTNLIYSLEDMGWEIAVMLAGEERIEKNYERKAAQTIISIAGSRFDNGEDGSIGLEPVSDEDVSERVVQDDTVHILMSCLTARQQESVKLYYFQGLTQQEIADRLNISKPAVCKQLKNAETTIRKKSKFFSNSG